MFVSKIKIGIKDVIIVVLAVLLFLSRCGRESDDPETSTETTITEKVLTEVDSSSVPGIKDREPEEVSVLETPQHVEVVPEPEKLSPEEKKLVKPAFRYRDTTSFGNATVYSDILSEGRILKLDLKTSIDHLERTIETTKKTTSNAGGLFLSPSVSYAPVIGLEALEVNLNFIKGNIGFGFGGFYNIRSNTPGIKIIFHKKLF
ncbi:hypothetical protein RM553_12650 [Zunongwangia sp. F363]|uniref:Lipoprotein n=1 Tax=Autumnicola tepida TaxID=3075595 RepID=A0ABU3CBH4_9FLAO|nr:hypothetical protein [Zunongwangia sp. F363]MDT0643684.1 hypothetical protein [Zunongwangia sp. F363]